ncbi:diguanylate cyclase/phosphodiesterase [Noviherbaspirillum humi]|uniref:Diguanylate cyclase/phosphodiesterase n=2 Tax=Noviherbaspirillum humi TaxID=1688639 RepID=A0A239ICL7_9BURK|nr:diguanylate cyclase/phosphodiesterase [Noviherbaspirillum humi]
MIVGANARSFQRNSLILLCTIIGFSLALLVAIWLTIHAHLLRERERTMLATFAGLDKIVRTYEKQTLLSLRQFDQVSKFLKYEYEQSNGSVDLGRTVQRAVLASDAVILASIANEHGDIVAATAGNASKPVNIRDREHFRVHLGTNSDRLFISAPVIGRVSGEETLNMSRRLNHADGSFAGVVVVSVKPSVLTDSYNETDLGREGMLSVLGKDGIYRALRIGAANRRSMKIDFDRFVAAQQDAARRSAALTLPELDPVSRYSVMLNLKEYPLAISAAIPEADVMRQIGHEADSEYRWGLLASALTLLFMLVAITLALKLNSRQRMMERLATHDRLTALPNRSLLNSHLARMIERTELRQEQAIAVMFIDLDRFKEVNDTLGHAAGDELLSEASRRLRRVVRDADLVARLGGDEFSAVALCSHGRESASALAEKLLAALAAPFSVAGQEMFISASIGISLFPSDGRDREELFKNADTAMYQAKAAGRNRYAFFTPEMSMEMKAHLSVEQALRRALERHEFEVHYQPRIDLRSMQIVGMEALLRWNHPELGRVPPMQFIPIAEERGLIEPIGRWVLQEACARTRYFIDRFGRPLRVSVNISACQLQRFSLVGDVRAALDAAGLPHGLLELELTESALVNDMELSARMLAQIKKLGIQIALDDFGTGYSGLAYLQRFPIDVLKLDRSFINQQEGAESRKVIEAFIRLAHVLDLKVVAEGIETADTTSMLKGLGCDEGQGYFLGKPMPAAEFERFLMQTPGLRCAAPALAHGEAL